MYIKHLIFVHAGICLLNIDTTVHQPVVNDHQTSIVLFPLYVKANWDKTSEHSNKNTRLSIEDGLSLYGSSDLRFV